MSEIQRLLEIALGNDEEYVREDELIFFPRSFSSDAVLELREIFGEKRITREEVALCVAALTKPARMENGGSKQFLLALGTDSSVPIFDVLIASSDVRVQRFALEAGNQQSIYMSDSRLYPLLDMELCFLEDPDDEIRLAAVISSVEIVRESMEHLDSMIEQGEDHWFVVMYRTSFKLLNDPSPKVRAAAEELGGYMKTARAAFIERLKGETDAAVRKMLITLIEEKGG